MNTQDHTQNLLDNKLAASYLGFSPSTLANSRYTGLLGGVKAPRFKKFGKVIRYSKESLDLWVAQFGDQCSTSETNSHGA